MRFFSTIARSPRKLISIALDWTRPKDPPLSLGQASMLANLQKHNIPVVHNAWSVNHANFDINEVHDYVMQHARPNTDLALGAFVWHEPHTQTLLTKLKKEGFPGRIILGGPQISYTKQNLEKFYPQADVFVRGYGEQALVKLLKSDAEKPVVSGVHYAGEPDMGLSASVDLENLPSPFLTDLIKPQPFIRLETQRGCPFRCAFCQHRESDVSMVRREFSHSRIIDEINWIIDNPIIQDIAILDPTFNSGSLYLKVLEKFIERKYTGKLALQCRTEMVKPEFLDAVSELNNTANVVLEFGLQTTNKAEAALIQRPNNMKKINAVFKETKARGIETEASLIFGLPNQTLQSFQHSIDFCKEHEVTRIYAFPLMLLRGTPLYDKKEEYNLVESSDLQINNSRVQENIPHVIASDSFTYDDWQQMASLAAGLDTYNQQQKMQNTLMYTSWHKKSHETATNISIGRPTLI